MSRAARLKWRLIAGSWQCSTVFILTSYPILIFHNSLYSVLFSSPRLYLYNLHTECTRVLKSSASDRWSNISAARRMQWIGQAIVTRSGEALTCRSVSMNDDIFCLSFCLVCYNIRISCIKIAISRVQVQQTRSDIMQELCIIPYTHYDSYPRTLIFLLLTACDLHTMSPYISINGKGNAQDVHCPSPLGGL